MEEDNKTHLQIEQLIQGCIKGDPQAQSHLYKLFMQKMFVVCLRYSKNREEAEEVLQEGFMRVFEYIHQYKFAGSFEGWMRKVMVNCALQKYRSKTQLRFVVDTEVADREQVDNEEIISRIGTKELLSMVQQLPPSCRLVFNLYVFEGMKHREIADLLKISEGTSKSNLSDARTLLQKAVTNSLQVVKQKTI
jgi:RNA polymerase sigma factor (sigma-70 family)